MTKLIQNSVLSKAKIISIFVRDLLKPYLYNIDTNLQYINIYIQYTLTNITGNIQKKIFESQLILP